VIEVQELTKFYGERKILHELHFTIKSGRICGLLGPNGSGKSTTMDILSGLLGPSSGIARVCGFDVVKNPQDVKKCVGYLPDNPPLYRDMHVRDFVDYVAKLRGIKNANERKKTVEEVMSECDVTDVANRMIGNLSKGYRQRVALCAALVHKPKVLVLDEPTEGLDPNQILHIRNLIKKLASDRTVILSSHILSEVQATCHEVVIINNGKIAAHVDLEKSFGSHHAYVYTFASKASAAMEWLQQKSFVEVVKAHPAQAESVIVQFSQEFFKDPSHVKNDLANVTQQIVQQGFYPIGIEEKRDGIEEIFFDVIRHQDQTRITGGAS
jgi:ABC-2 type transport system ATP-binding protein